MDQPSCSKDFVLNMGCPSSPDQSSSQTVVNISSDSDTDVEDHVYAYNTKDSNITLFDLANRFSEPDICPVWCCGLLHKNSKYLVKGHLITGDHNITKSILRLIEREKGKFSLRISKIISINRINLSVMMKNAGMFAVYLTMPCLERSTANDNCCLPIQPMSHLISYLNQKNGIGVVSLAIKVNPDLIVDLYVIPPSKSSAFFLKPFFENINNIHLKEDHLVIVAICRHFFIMQ